jgi:hypothetical protein
MRIVVCSFPKAGTYYLSAILDRLGLKWNGYHAIDGSVTDYRSTSREGARNSSKSLTRPVELGEILSLVQNGEHLLSHISGSEEAKHLLKPFKVVFLHREVRATFISHMRFFSSTNRGTERTDSWRMLPDGPDKTLAAFEDFGAIHLGMCRALLSWHGDVGGLELDFETLIGDRGEDAASNAVLRLARYCDLSSEGLDPISILTAIRGTLTNTWSGKRSDVASNWSAGVERMFRAEKGHEINQALGHHAAPWDSPDKSQPRINGANIRSFEIRAQVTDLFMGRVAKPLFQRCARSRGGRLDGRSVLAIRKW